MSELWNPTENKLYLEIEMIDSNLYHHMDTLKMI